MFTDIMILEQLRNGPKHGYEIKQFIESTLGGTYQMTNSKLYPSLKRFEEMGAIEREVIRQEGKPDKHLYHFTAVGQEILHDLITDFAEDKARREGEFYVRVTCFPLLTVEERLTILRSRLAVLRKRRTSVQQWGEKDNRLSLHYLKALSALRKELFDVETRTLETWIADEMAYSPSPGSFRNLQHRESD